MADKVDIESLPNLASTLLGSKIVYATDEWFASAERMIRDDEAVWKEDVYSKCGKWMDGWECRRRRTEGHDWCVVKLGCSGIIRAIEVDTAFFTGNYSPKVSIQGAYFKTASQAETKLLQLRQKCMVDEDQRMGYHASEEETQLIEEVLLQATGKSHTSNDILNGHANPYEWIEIVPLTPLRGGYPDTRHNYFYFTEEQSRQMGAMSHLRINMGPDGGIARCRVYGEVIVSPDVIRHSLMNTHERNVYNTTLYDVPTKSIDLLAVEIGGVSLACSNKHYGHPRNVMNPGRGTCMGDGWETARQPKRPEYYTKDVDGLMVLPGSDWCILKLGMPGVITKIVIDTHFYAGNFPESCKIDGCDATNTCYGNITTDDQFRYTAQQTIQAIQACTVAAEAVKMECPVPAGIVNGWVPILARTRLKASAIHEYSVQQQTLSVESNHTTFSHLRLTIYPDGGIMRVRVYGQNQTIMNDFTLSKL